MPKGINIDLEKEVWEGWRVKDFIADLRPSLDGIQNGEGWLHPPFESKAELREWLKANQPGYKKVIPEVVDFFANMYNIKK